MCGIQQAVTTDKKPRLLRWWVARVRAPQREIAARVCTGFSGDEAAYYSPNPAVLVGDAKAASHLGSALKHNRIAGLNISAVHDVGLHRSKNRQTATEGIVNILRRVDYNLPFSIVALEDGAAERHAIANAAGTLAIEGVVSARYVGRNAGGGD